MKLNYRFASIAVLAMSFVSSLALTVSLTACSDSSDSSLAAVGEESSSSVALSSVAASCSSVALSSSVASSSSAKTVSSSSSEKVAESSSSEKSAQSSSSSQSSSSVQTSTESSDSGVCSNCDSYTAADPVLVENGAVFAVHCLQEVVAPYGHVIEPWSVLELTFQFLLQTVVDVNVFHPVGK